MLHHGTRLVPVLITLLLAVPGHAPGSPPLGEATSTALDSLAVLEGDGFVGSVLVSAGDSVLFEGDFGFDEPPAGRPSYWVASISKQFTAAAVLLLAEGGMLALEDSLGRFFPLAPADHRVITLHQLLCHTSGVPQDYAADEETELEAAAAAVFARPLAHEPGARFTYSNDGYALLAMIVEKVSGQPFETVVRERVFQPAAMTRVGFWPPDPQDPGLPLVVETDFPATWGWKGPTGMRASVGDLYRWARALVHDRVLTAASRELLWGDHVSTTGGTGVGYGWFHPAGRKGTVLNTNGYEDNGANAVLYYFPKRDLTLIAATHAGPAEGLGLPPWSRRVRDLLIRVYDAEAD